MQRHPAEETPYAQTMRATGTAFPSRRLLVAPGRTGATGATRSNPLGLVGGNRRHLALHPQQRHFSDPVMYSILRVAARIVSGFKGTISALPQKIILMSLIGYGIPIRL